MTRAIVTCSPFFSDLALNELRRHHPDLSIEHKFAPGYFCLTAPGSFDKLTRPWRKRLPIYLHHLFPVHDSVRLTAGLDDLAALTHAVKHIAPPDATLQLRSTVEDVPMLAQITDALPDHRRTQRTNPPTGRILSMLLTLDAGGYCAYLGVSWATQNISPWPGGQLAITESVPNRAGFKLLEALDSFAIRLRRHEHVLDLGAAPGAWTTVLRRRGLTVTAVAPTALYPWLEIDPGVTYYPMLAEDFLGRCVTTFDLIVNDMKLDAQDSARLMVDYAAHLRQEGIAIMTLKLHERNKRRVMDHALRLLRRAYKIIRVRQLVYNRIEVTLFLRRKS